MSNHSPTSPDEHAPDSALVRRLLTAQFPAWARLPVTPLASGGTVHDLFRLGTDRTVRLPRHPSAAPDVRKEQAWLPWLAPQLPLAVPQLLGTGEPSTDFPLPWSVHGWLPGTHPRAGQTTRATPLAAELAAFLRALHRLDTTGAPPAYRGVPLHTVDDEVRSSLTRLDGLVDTEAARRAWQQTLDVPAWHGDPVWLHSDLMPGNLLTDGEHLTAVLDFGTMGVGDPACDLIPAWNLLPSAARTTFRAAVDCDEATWARGRGWALSMALIQLPTYHDTNATMAENARYVLRSVLGQKAVA